jgi:hypothetical protein
MRTLRIRFASAMRCSLCVRFAYALRSLCFCFALLALCWFCIGFALAFRWHCCRFSFVFVSVLHVLHIRLELDLLFFLRLRCTFALHSTLALAFRLLCVQIVLALLSFCPFVLRLLCVRFALASRWLYVCFNIFPHHLLTTTPPRYSSRFSTTCEEEAKTHSKTDVIKTVVTTKQVRLRLWQGC